MCHLHFKYNNIEKKPNYLQNWLMFYFQSTFNKEYQPTWATLKTNTINLNNDAQIKLNLLKLKQRLL